MAIGKHAPKTAANDCWKDAIRIMLDEATTALEEAFGGLSDEQLRAHPLPGRHTILTMVMHAIQTADDHWVGFQTGRRLLGDSEMFDMWSHGPAELDALQAPEDLPSAGEIVEKLRAVRDAAFAGLDEASEDDLRSDRAAKGVKASRGWTAGHFYFRSICHVLAHTRQIWLLRGAMGLTDQQGWPEQHYA